MDATVAIRFLIMSLSVLECISGITLQEKIKLTQREMVYTCAQEYELL